MCHRAAAITAARGIRPSTQQSPKKSPLTTFLGDGPETSARMLLPRLWWKLSQRTSNCGPAADGADGDTLAATSARCRPKRPNELLAWPNDMQVSIIACCAPLKFAIYLTTLFCKFDGPRSAETLTSPEVLTSSEDRCMRCSRGYPHLLWIAEPPCGGKSSGRRRPDAAGARASECR